MSKIVGIVALILVGYFLFFKDSAPSSIYINGQEYGPRQLDRTNDSLSKVYNYPSKTVANHDYVSLLYPDRGTGSLESWLELFATHFTKQGFVFEKIGSNRKGVKSTVAVYMMPLPEEKLLAMYIVEDIEKSGIPMDDSAFQLIQNMILK
jgi:hypothetical protein